MKTIVASYPKSAFLSVEKDLSIITDMIIKNDRLKKLLYWTSKDALDKPVLTPEQTSGLFGKNIKIVPKLYIDPEAINYIIINFDNFVQSDNPEFRDNVIEFDIICHFDQWHLQDFQLRPYKIAAELDSMFNKKHLSGIGTLQFLSASQIILTDEYAGLCLMYLATHDGDDTKNALDPREQKDITENYNNIFNNGLFTPANGGN